MQTSDQVLGPFPYLPFASIRREGTDAVVKPWGYKKYGGTEHGEEVRILNVFTLTPGKDLGREVQWIGFVDHRSTVAEVLRLTGHQSSDPTHFTLSGNGRGYSLEIASGVALWRTS